MQKERINYNLGNKNDYNIEGLNKKQFINPNKNKQIKLNLGLGNVGIEILYDNKAPYILNKNILKK